MKQYDVAEEEIKTLETTRQVPAALTFRSPVAGVVVDKTIVNGMHVEAGEMLYRLADLSVLVVEADFREADLAMVKVGAQAQVTLDGLQGETRSGRVTSVYPYLADDTRTLKARIELPNPGLRLKPGMSAAVIIEATGGEGLVVPTDAVVDSGDRQIVFVGDGQGHFEPRSIALGQRGEQHVIVRQGLREGELVAERGIFFLDSESQMKAALENFAGPAPAGPSVGAERQDVVQLSLKVSPNPPRSGSNTFEVHAKDQRGQPVVDANVSLQLTMPAMPTMNMPAMTVKVALDHTGGGIYRGSGDLSMAGRWDATITSRREGHIIGSAQATLLAR